MDRGMSRSTPYLPRYQSLSPARSPQLGRHRFTSLRSVSQPSQRIYYIDNAPTRVINSYHVHHSPSPNRTYKIHLCSSKTNHYLTRVTRSQSAYDINSSHLYTSQEDLFDKSIREATTRRVGSCEDIYHKAPFFPDVTPSESGVSFGESEEGSTCGGEDDSVSQHSFGSSSAFYEVTVDNELDKCDSDNFSGPDCVGERPLGVLHENDLEENINSDKRKRGPRRSYRELLSPDSSCTGPLSYAELRKRELASSPSWDFEKSQSRPDVLRVLIPDNETPAKASGDNKVDDRKAISSTPLAHSTPHVSPGSTEDLKLYAVASWNVDDPFEEADAYTDVRKSKTAKAVCDQDSDSRHSSRLYDSNCNSSCSEDNYSDVSNVTVSSPVPRKTKLVKKHSDKPASSKASSMSYLHNRSGIMNNENTEFDSNAKTAQQCIHFTLGKAECEHYVGVSSGHVNADNYQDRQTSNVISSSVKEIEQVIKDNTGDEWWADYNIGTATGLEAKVLLGSSDKGEKLSSYQRDIRVVKPLAVNIPLISAGKHGREKLRKLSQTSPPLAKSSSRSPTLSPRESTQTQENEKNENKIADRGNQANTNHFEEALRSQQSGLMKFDYGEYYKHPESEEGDGKKQGFPHDLPHDLLNTLVAKNENSVGCLKTGKSPLIWKISQNEQCFESLLQAREHVLTRGEEGVIHVMLNENEKAFHGVTRNEGAQFSSCKEIEKPDGFSSRDVAYVCETADVDNYKDMNKIYSNIGTSERYFDSRRTEQVIDNANDEEVASLNVNDQRTKPHHGTWTYCDELDSAEGSMQDTRGAPDKFSSRSSLPASATQVYAPSSGDSNAFLAGKSDQLDTDTSGSKEEILSKEELAENDVHITDSERNNSVITGEKLIDICLLEKSSSPDNYSTCGQEQINVGISSEITVSSEYFECVLFENISTVETGETSSCDIAESRDRLFVESSSGEAITESVARSSVVKQDEQEGLSGNFQNTAAAETGITRNNIDIENFIEPRIASTRSMTSTTECQETPQMGEHVVATAQRIEDSIKHSDISQHQNASVTHHLTSSLTPSYDSSDNSERTSNSADINELTNIGTHDSFDQQLTDSLDIYHADETINASKQQEAVGTDNLILDNDESITRPSDVADGGEKGVHRDEHFCTEKNVCFLERGEEFTHCPSVQEKSVNVTEVSSKQKEHIYSTAVEKIVTTEQTVKHSPLGLSSCNNYAGVDIVTDKSVCETVVKELGDCTNTTTNTLYTDAGKDGTVVTDTSSLAVDASTVHLPVFSTTAQSELVFQRGVYILLHSAASTHLPSSSSRLTAETTAPGVSIMKEESDNQNLYTVTDSGFAHQIYPPVTTNIVDKFPVEEVFAPAVRTSTAAMHHSSPLDNLQAQLSLISGNTSCTQLVTASGGDQFQDHAEATSVLKQIVRGDTGDFTHFSNTSCGNVDGGNFGDYSVHEGSVVSVTDELSKPLVASFDNNVDYDVARERYDNDYDYVTTDLPKGSKLLTRPHHHLHPLKPGQFKTSSLWTLQEETENVMDNLSPKQSPKLSHVIVASDEDNCNRLSGQSSLFPHKSMIKKDSWNANENENALNNRIQNSEYENKTLASDSSDFGDSDGNYSSISTADSLRSSSYGREQTPLSETDSVNMGEDDGKIGHLDVDNASKQPDIYPASNFHECVPGLAPNGTTTDWTNNSHVSVTGTDKFLTNSSVDQGETGESILKNFRSSLAFCISSPESNEVIDAMSALDRLAASLEQFSTTDLNNEDWKSFQLTEDELSASDWKDSDLSTSNILGSNDDAVSDTSCLRTFDLDLASVSTGASSMPTDYSDGSMYTCTGTAEIKKTSSFHYDIPAYTPKTNFKPSLMKSAVDQKDELHDEKVKRFEKLLNEFNKDLRPSGVVCEFMFLREKSIGSTDSAPSSSEDLYKTFTNDDSEKKQNHVCIVVEDENMNTFRFKRYLKKSHTKRKKGRKVLRFLNKLGCVSETVGSPDGSPNTRMKLADEVAQAFTTDSMLSSKPRISNPILISSTSFHHFDVLNSSRKPVASLSSSQSLESMHSRADSAYSSISESVAGALNSPASRHVSFTSFHASPAPSGSVSSVFCSGSTSGDWSFSDSVFSSSTDATIRTLNSVGEDDVIRSLPDHTGGPDSHMMSALADVFDQLTVCEDEIDSALLNRMRYGHTEAEVKKK